MFGAVKPAGLANHFACFGKLSVNGLSMSMTVDRPTSPTARVEYSFGEAAKRRNRPRLIIGLASVVNAAAAADFKRLRRVILFLIRFSMPWVNRFRLISGPWRALIEAANYDRRRLIARTLVRWHRSPLLLPSAFYHLQRFHTCCGR